jgi:1-pyrroline-5-carboxylate dehydrogenase
VIDHCSPYASRRVAVASRVEFRPLEGFVLAVTPFNFTAIGGNLVFAPAVVGNVVLWKPSPAATYSNYIIHKIFLEAGLPPSVIQFVPVSSHLPGVGPDVSCVCARSFSRLTIVMTNDDPQGSPPDVVKQCIDHPEFAGLHFTGSTHIFRKLWKDIAANIDTYKGYPRIVGETGGKNFHLYHPSADVPSGVVQAVRAAFEYQGQKCSALSRCYVPKSMWEDGGFKGKLVDQVGKIEVGPPTEAKNFVGPVIGRPAWDKITGIIKKAKEQGGEVIAGGGCECFTRHFSPALEQRSVTLTDVFGLRFLFLSLPPRGRLEGVLRPTDGDRDQGP